MSKNRKSAFWRSYEYARAYSIVITPPTTDETGKTWAFLSLDGDTEWPSHALHFDTAAEAEAMIVDLQLPRVVDRKTGEEYPMVVEVTLESKIRKVTKPAMAGLEVA